VTETWSYTNNPDGSITGAVAGRVKKPAWPKVNPIWWLYNSDDPMPPLWYQPNTWNWLRTIMWYARNPFHNLQFYVIGVADRNYSMVTTWVNPAVKDGNYRSSISVGWLRLPFVSRENAKITFHLGWQYNGDFAIRFYVNNSKVQVI